MIQKSLSWSLGDWLLHIRYGLGRYIGVKTIKVQNRSYECVGIEQGVGKHLWLPTDLISELGFFCDKSQKVVKNLTILSKLKQFQEDARLWCQRIVEQSLLRNSISVPAMRIIRPESPHKILTQSQIKCLEEISRDLASGRLMDRVVYGDVCTGKTEIAIQTTRIVLHNDGQVLILVPTTVLADQHFDVFVARFGEEIVKCVTRATDNVREVIEGVSDGSVKIVIATHAVVRNKDWSWHNLRLAIVDEEHCFGAADKEFAKFQDSHCLWMSATPLPRTTHMAMIGARKISILKEMPADKQIAETHVVSSINIASLVEPTGQIICVCRKIADMPDVVKKIESDLAAANIRANVYMVHGQMPYATIRSTLNTALNEDSAILVSTALVGVGLDKECVHTLVVCDAHNWGLGQLHQLRGRVSRSSRKGKAYFVSDQTELPERVKLLEKCTDGWQLAQYDRELRGSGSVAGTQQSGRAIIGDELGLTIMRDAAGKHVMIDLEDFRYQIPAEYISCPDSRVFWYKKLASVFSRESLDECKNEIIGNYGVAQDGSMDDFWEFQEIKLVAQDLGARYVSSYKKDQIAVRMRDDTLHLLTKPSSLTGLKAALSSISLKERECEKKLANA